MKLVTSFNQLQKWFVCPSLGFPGGSVVKNLPTNAGDAGLIPGSRRCPGEGNGNLLQYSWLGNPMDRRAWRATVCGMTKESDIIQWLNNNIPFLSFFHHWMARWTNFYIWTKNGNQNFLLAFPGNLEKKKKKKHYFKINCLLSNLGYNLFYHRPTNLV